MGDVRVIIEGAPRSGKTTVRQLLQAHLEEWGLRVVLGEVDYSARYETWAQRLEHLRACGVNVILEERQTPRQKAPAKPKTCWRRLLRWMRR